MILIQRNINNIIVLNRFMLVYIVTLGNKLNVIRIDINSYSISTSNKSVILQPVFSR